MNIRTKNLYSQAIKQCMQVRDFNDSFSGSGSDLIIPTESARAVNQLNMRSTPHGPVDKV